VSNTTYEKFSRKGNADMVRASGIPGLRRFCHSITAGAQLLEAKHFLQSTLSSLLNSIELWANSSPARARVEDGRPDESIYEILHEVKTEVHSIPNLPLYRANQRRHLKLFTNLERASITPFENYFWNF
jgi:hypothetical protein